VTRPRRSLITGVGGQDGSYLAEMLLAQGYEVWGIVRRPVAEYEHLAHLEGSIGIVAADLLDQASVAAAIRTSGAREIYNLASPSFVPRSWDEPVQTATHAAVGVTSLLEAVREVDPSIRLYQASSSEIFGEATETPQTEMTRLGPLTPYGVAKAYGHFIAHSYRRRYGMYCSCGILYNHESPRRPLDFLPRKVATFAAAISLGLEQELVLGDLDSRRDWGYAKDFVHAMWLMLQQDEPDDYVVATGESHSVQDLVERAFTHVGLDWREHVRSDPALRRGAAELHHLVGDPSRTRQRLGWEPTVDFDGLVQLLVDAELDRFRAQENRA
jgi:GDPmannose 4,6-dehydratase